MSNYRADLHCHSNCSDGTCSPNMLIDHAKKANLNAISITDHDSLNAYTEDVFQYAQKVEIKLLTGIEFSARFSDLSVHILGYGVEKTDEILAFCNEHACRRKERNNEIINNLKKCSIFIDLKEIENTKAKTIGRPHIAQLMVKHKYVESIQEAFDKYIGEGKCCYYPGKDFSPKDTVDVIHNAGGKAFIAHPHILKSQKIVTDLLVFGFDGIECYYGQLHSSIEQKWINFAHKNHLLISGGSDFHGDIKPHIKIGCSWVDQAQVKQIFGKA